MFAKWTFKFDFQPIVNALAVELMGARHCFDHATSFKHIHADSTVNWTIGFFSKFSSLRSTSSPFSNLCCRLFVFECWIWVYDISDLLRRQLLLLVDFFVILLLGILLLMPHTWIISTFSTVFIVIRRRITICVILKLLLSLLVLILMLESGCVEGVACEIHLYIGWSHPWQICHHILYVTENAWKVWETTWDSSSLSHTKRLMLSCAWSLVEAIASRKSVASKIELEVLLSGVPLRKLLLMSKVLMLVSVSGSSMILMLMMVRMFVVCLVLEISSIVRPHILLRLLMMSRRCIVMLRSSLRYSCKLTCYIIFFFLLTLFIIVILITVIVYILSDFEETVLILLICVYPVLLSTLSWYSLALLVLRLLHISRHSAGAWHLLGLRRILLLLAICKLVVWAIIKHVATNGTVCKGVVVAINDKLANNYNVLKLIVVPHDNEIFDSITLPLATHRKDLVVVALNSHILHCWLDFYLIVMPIHLEVLNMISHMLVAVVLIDRKCVLGLWCCTATLRCSRERWHLIVRCPSCWRLRLWLLRSLLLLLLLLLVCCCLSCLLNDGIKIRHHVLQVNRKAIHAVHEIRIHFLALMLLFLVVLSMLVWSRVLPFFSVSLWLAFQILFI